MVDALALGASGAIYVGSSPTLGTKSESNHYQSSQGD
jgi:hypothetical protein